MRLWLKQETNPADEGQFFRAPVDGIGDAVYCENQKNDAADIENGGQSGRDGRVNAAEQHIQHPNKNARHQRVGGGEDQQDQTLIGMETGIMGAAGEQEGDQHQKAEVRKCGDHPVAQYILSVESERVVPMCHGCGAAAAGTAVLRGGQDRSAEFAFHMEKVLSWESTVIIAGFDRVCKAIPRKNEKF